MAKRKLSDLGANFVEVPLTAEAPPLDEAAPADEAPPTAPAEPKTGISTALGLGAADDLSLGLADWMHGGAKALENKIRGRERVKLGAAFQPSPDDTPEIAALKRRALAKEAAQPSDTEVNRRAYQELSEQAQREHPAAFMAGGIGTGLVGGLAGGGLTKVPGILKAAAPVLDATGKALAPSLGRRIAGGMAGGFAQGAASGAGHSQALRSPERGGDQTSGTGQLILDMIKGGGFGLALGGAGPVAGDLVGAGARGIGRKLGIGGRAPIPPPGALADVAEEALGDAAPAAGRTQPPAGLATVDAVPAAGGRALPPVPVAANIEDALAQQAAAGLPALTPGAGGGDSNVAAQLAQMAGRGRGAGGGGRPGEEFGQAARGVVDEVRNADLLGRLVRAATPRRVSNWARDESARAALGATGFNLSQLGNLKPEQILPYGHFLNENAVQSASSKGDILNSLLKMTQEAKVGEKLRAGGIYDPSRISGRFENVTRGLDADALADIKPIMELYGDRLAKQIEMGGPGGTTLDEINALRSTLAKKVDWKNTAEKVPNELKKRLLGEITDDINEQAKEALSPQAFQEYLEARRNYGLAKKAIPTAERAVRAELGNSFWSPSRATAAAGGASVGGSIAGAPGQIAGGVVGYGVGDALKRRGQSVAARWLRQFSELTREANRADVPEAARRVTRDQLEELFKTLDREFPDTIE